MLSISSIDWDIKRRPPRGDGLEVFGDAALLDFWLERVSFE
jgi:hypothetical protein